MSLSAPPRRQDLNTVPAAEPRRVEPAVQPTARRRKVLSGLLAVAGLLLVALLASAVAGLGGSDSELVCYTVRRGPLPITVTERGELESQDEVRIVCEVDDIVGDGIRGTPILSIVPNGASVRKGDLLVEFDCTNHRERYDRQVLLTEKARAVQIQARVKYENRKTKNATRVAEARLRVDLAELALKQFEDEQGGTFQIRLQELDLLIQEAEAGQLIERTNLEGILQLYKLGYRSSGEVAQARLTALRAERNLATAISKKKELVEYEYQKKRLELEGAVASAERALEQVRRDNAALLEQAKAGTVAADEALKKETERLERYRTQIANAKLFSPKDGMVAYAPRGRQWWLADVRPGAAIYPKQTVLTLPNLQRMQVKTTVHESVLDQVSVELPATIRVDAFRERSYRGTVRSVAVLASQEGRLGSGTKVYDTVVTIDEEVEQLKPGMTAVVEIHIDRLDDVLSVPVQAIVRIGTDNWCYVLDDSLELRRVELGAANDAFVEVRSGLREGDPIVLDPTSIVGESEEATQKAIGPGED